MLRTHLLVSERAARDNDQVYRDAMHAQFVRVRRTVHRDCTTDNTVCSLQPSPEVKRSREMRLYKRCVIKERDREREKVSLSI